MNQQLSQLVKKMLLDGEFILLFEPYLETMESSLEVLEHHEVIFLDEDGSNILVLEFKSMLRNSFFVSLYSFFELMLEEECREKGIDRWKAFKDLNSGTGLLRTAKIYFTKEPGASFPDTAEWREIQNYRLLRNSIVHNRARLSDNGDHRLRKYVFGNNSLRCVDDEILLEKEFCKDANEVIRTFLRQLSFGER